MLDFITVISDVDTDESSMRAWFMGPMRRAMVGSMIFIWASIAAAVPGVNIVSSILFGYWATADYFDYYWDAEEGPILPPSA